MTNHSDLNDFSQKVNSILTTHLLLLLLTILLVGCAGTRSNITAPHAMYPVSFSPTIRGPSGELLDSDELQKISEFKFQYSSSHMLFSLIPLSENCFDLSETLNEKIGECQGEGIINLKVETFSNMWSWFASMFILGIFPVYYDVEITGDIVKRKTI